ncbi:MAG: HypC/HybG/HupF family hydrogenase formation chaperone [candidate division Zixibacteria bacterium]|nr:HypC/HybG/HupF family hydrogenase formation chaperone [candidate division Zixibacteria bacterium]MBU1470855.1 HypC/HybG/HupF family hydrogenase formation chaperone [candidate division Zixibacteria bacterium]MBU2625725.1 HypC/HybG/HupF family hydrogenase formation chaperone [candidate division Zixibacteria bacterium]
MCLAVPGQIASVKDEGRFSRSGKVSFDGVMVSVNLSCVPEADIGDFVLVHAGVAIGRINQDEARRTLALLAQAFDDNPGGKE